MLLSAACCLQRAAAAAEITTVLGAAGPMAALAADAALEMEDAIRRRARMLELEQQMNPRAREIFNAVAADDVELLRRLVKHGQDFALRNGAGEDILDMARARGKTQVLSFLEGLRRSMADGYTAGLEHSIRVAANSAQMEDMITAAEETTLVSSEALADARRRQRKQRALEAEAAGDLARVMSTAKFANEMATAIQRHGGHCEFEQLRRAKEQLAQRQRIEATARGLLKASLDYDDSSQLAIALVKAEESGMVDDETLDAAWEVGAQKSSAAATAWSQGEASIAAARGQRLLMTLWVVARGRRCRLGASTTRSWRGRCCTI
eukprot:COSAG01_NODE_5066_length_4517_cov_2.332277_6_plen_322_part_01